MGSAVAGYGGSVAVSSHTVLNVKDWELPLAADLYDVSVLGNQWKQYIPGQLGTDIKLDVEFDLTDTQGQVALQSALLNSTSVSLVLTTSNAGGATTHTYSCTAFMKSLDIKDAVNAAEEASLTLTASGAVTFS